MALVCIFVMLDNEVRFDVRIILSVWEGFYDQLISKWLLFLQILQEEKCSLFSYGCMLCVDIYILNNQRTSLNMHTTLTQLKTSSYWLDVSRIISCNDEWGLSSLRYFLLGMTAADLVGTWRREAEKALGLRASGDLQLDLYKVVGQREVCCRHHQYWLRVYSANKQTACGL